MTIHGTIQVNELYCKGCALCVPACPQSVIAMNLDHLTSKGYHPAFLRGEGCTGCEICAIVCPDAAITVYREARARRN